jgi:hypothetical protein
VVIKRQRDHIQTAPKGKSNRLPGLMIETIFFSSPYPQLMKGEK